MRGQRGAAARAVGHDLVTLVQKPHVGNLLQAPPYALDVFVVIGDVGVFHVRPVADAVGHALPFTLIFPYGFLALFDERLDAVLLDLLLAVQTQQFFHLQLYRQTVGIPAGLAQHLHALHRAVAREQILEHARFDVADVRLAVGRGRAVVEREYIRAFALIDGFLEDVILFPEVQNFFFARQKVKIRRDLFKHVPVLPA